MKKMKLKKSIFNKLISSFVLFCALFTLTFAACLILEAAYDVGWNVEKLYPTSQVDDEGNISDLDSVTNFGGWIEELDEENRVVNVYGTKRSETQVYTTDEIYSLTSVLGDTDQIGFIIKPENYPNHYLFLYSRNRFEFTPTVIINREKGTVSHDRSGWFLLLFFGLLLVEILCISIYLRRKIKRPLSQLIEGMERIRSGEEGVLLNIKTEAEFEQIVDTFNGMTNELEKQKSENRRLVEQKNRLLLDLSHDLRTPIATIKSCANALEAGLVPDDKIQSYYKTIELKADRVQLLSEDMFFMLKADDPEDKPYLEQTDICEFLRKLCAEYYDEIEGAGFEFEIDIPDEAVFIEIDRRLFARVIGNLLTNARKYNSNGRVVGIRCQSSGERIVIEVYDDGEEIDKELSEQMFSPFVRGDKTRSSVGGTGLGLSISKMIVEKHGGALKYKRDIERNIIEIII